MQNRYLSLLAAIGFLATSCATQTASRVSSTDDIYYTAGDVQPTTITTTTTTTTDPAPSAGYSTYPGNSGSQEYAIQPSDDADYRTTSDDVNPDTYYDDQGNTYVVNNYYDNDYGYDDDYYYTSSIYRFYQPYYGFNYYSHCYSPYYYDPYWSQPYYGYGWNIGFGWGGYHGCGYNSYYSYNPYGWYDPWYSPYGYGYGYGYNPYYGGYYNGYNNGYYNGYNNGYYNGYYDGYYGSGYGSGYNDYNGYSDNGYYYGPNTGTGSNTNTGSSSAEMLTSGYDKQNPEMNHVFTDKGVITIDKDLVNTTAGSTDLADAANTPEYNSVKGLITKDAVSEVSGLSTTGVIATSKPATVASPEAKTGTSVKVVKYYKPETASGAGTPSQTSKAPVTDDRGVRNTPAGSDFGRPDYGSPSNGNTTPKTGGDRPQYQPNQQVPQYQQHDNNTQSRPDYNQPKYNNRNDSPVKGKDQPSKPSRTYEQPKSRSNSDTHSGGWNNSGSSRPSGNYNSGSSNGSRSNNGGSAPTKRSGGK